MNIDRPPKRSRLQNWREKRRLKRELTGDTPGKTAEAKRAARNQDAPSPETMKDIGAGAGSSRGGA